MQQNENCYPHKQRASAQLSPLSCSMDVDLINDGPFTIILDTEDLK
jgi:D-Tyr-tRNAtyr deacylase